MIFSEINQLKAYVKDEMYKTKYAEKSNELTKTLNLVISGDIESKNELKDNIRYILNEILEESQLNALIETYHVNYFERIYTGNNPSFSEILNKPLIKKNDPVKTRLDTLTQIVFQELYGLSVIDNYSYGDIKALNEIETNSSQQIWFQIKGKKERISKLFFNSEKNYEEMVKKSVSFDSTKDLKTNNPEVLCQRINGARVTATMPPYSKYYSLNIRFFNADFISKETLIKSKTSNEYFEQFIDTIMSGRPNIFVLGDMGVGKTTYLLRLIGSIPDSISILTMESMFELNIDKYFTNKNVKALQFLDFKTPNDALQTGLRQNRDIMIDGEVRLPSEADVTLQAMTRQGRGSLGSFHTTSSEDFMYDYKNLLMKTNLYTREESALYDIARAVDLLIFLAIDRSSGHRYIKEVTEVKLVRNNTIKPYDLNVLFKYDKLKKALIPVHKISDEFIARASEYEFSSEHLTNLKKLYASFKIA